MNVFYEALQKRVGAGFARLLMAGLAALFFPGLVIMLTGNIPSGLIFITFAVILAGVLSVTLAAPAAGPPAASGPEAAFEYLADYGFYRHPVKPGYFCGRCQSPLQAWKNGWRCPACGQLHQNPHPGGRARLT
ncbi:MAG: hypothetical protein P4N60_20720 [Verrucomicrobiae bacterium]|nr:hypothetical protein [Verrucomicrobiae bacterium]